MKLLTLDFESFYSKDYTLEKLTTEEFIRDPRWETQVVGLKFGRHPAAGLHPQDFAGNLHKVDWANTAVVSHHAHFEALALWHHYGVRPAFWFDTLSMARFLYTGKVGMNLADLSEFLGVTSKGVIPPEVKGMNLCQMPTHTWRSLADYCATDCEAELEAFQIMYPQIPEKELRLIDLTVRMFSEPVLGLNTPFLEEFAAWEEARRQSMLDRLGKTAKDFRSGEKFADILAAHRVDTREIPRTETGGFSFTKDSAWTQLQLNRPEDDPIRQLVEARLTFASNHKQSSTRRLLSMAGRGPITVYLNYHKPLTGRWSGGDKINFQNPDRVKRKKKVPVVLNAKGKPETEPVYGTGMMRRAICAPAGFELVVADASQIEARGVAYHARQMDMLDAFAGGRDIYSEFASRVYGRHVDRKGNPGDELPGFVGKVSILGLGYKMWWPHFASELLRGMMGADPVLLGEDTLHALNANVGKFMNNPKNLEKVRQIPTIHPWDRLVVHCICSWAIVNKYRDVNDGVRGLWEQGNDALHAMVTGREIQFGRNAHTEKHALVLASGRRLRYHDLERRGKEFRYYDPESHKWTYIYDGKIVENFEQADARDLVAYAMLDLSSTIRIAMMAHDEVVGVVPLGEGKAALTKMIARMSLAPDTHPGLPLAAEGGVALYYGDAK